MTGGRGENKNLFCSFQNRQGLFLPRVFQDMHSVAVPVGDVDQPPVIEVDVVRLDISDSPGSGRSRRFRDVKTDLPGPIRTRNVHDPQAGIEVVRKAVRQVWERCPEALEPIGRFYGVEVGARISDDSIWDRLTARQ